MKLLLVFFLFCTAFSFGQFSEFQHQCADGVERPYTIYTPKHIKKKKGRPLLVYLHGAISNPKLKENPLEYMQKSKLVALADAGGFHLMFCYGQKGATWFDSVGSQMVLDEITTALTITNADENKIFLTGFSDGASGTLYLSMTHPELFAGAIPMNGSLKVAAKLGGPDIFPMNSNHLPTYIINTTGDMLYAINQIQPTIEYLKQFNSNIIYRELEGNHEMSYLESEGENIIDFIEKNSRQTYTTIHWETTANTRSKIAWITVSELISNATQSNWHQPYELQVFNDKATFGMQYDYTFEGPGLKVNGFKSDSCTAKNMGVAIDDIVLLMEKDTMNSPYSPYFYIADKKAGAPTAITVIRDGKEMQLSGNFNPGYYYEIFEPAHPSGKINATIDGSVLKVSTSGIKTFEIDFEQLSSYEISSIEINGKTASVSSAKKQSFSIDK